MRVPTDSDFLDLWESGSRRHPLDRALLALGAAFPEDSFESLAAWPIGRRNRALIRLHCSCFGPTLRGMVSCAGCGERLEVSLDGRTMAGEGEDGTDGAEEAIDVNGEAFRLPSSRDLAGVVRETDPYSAARRLAEGCRLAAGGPAAWSEGELDEIGEGMARADPLAEIRVNLRCPECGDERDEVLDVVAFLWAEVDARVRRLLADIHALASAYGWSEPEILAMSGGRRAVYLEMLEP
jgi:hypothetical protein